ncbi:MAG: hypothetical protein HY904_06540 [Deltaproteobacteria bacterium]|nr:hypothetical protein [Deltaproteobacteria bacterium]
MVNLTSFGKPVTARTQAAKYVKERADLLAKYLSKHGLESDLDAIIEFGGVAQALNSAQGQSLGAGKGATGDVQARFVALQQSYNDVMAGLLAVIGDLKRAKPQKPDVITEAERIYKNESALLITITETDGGKKGEAARSKAQEALRAEIWKDADALLSFKGGKAALEKRGLTTDALTALKTNADDLAGSLATRTAKKGASKNVTVQERQAVADQADYWGSCYRILALTAENDESLKGLLKTARRPR